MKSDSPKSPETRLELVQALVDVAVTDSEYRDVYLRRARKLLAPVMSAEALEEARRDRSRLGALRSEATRAVEVGAWHRVRALAITLRAAERRFEETAQAVAAAERVFGADTAIGGEALAASTVSPLSATELHGIQTRTAARLERLAMRDPEWNAFYTARRAAVEAHPVEHRAGAAGAAADAQREQARAALRAGRWDALASLAEGLAGGRGAGEESCVCGALPEEPGTPHGATSTLVAGARYGLVAVSLDARDDLRTFLNCRCAMAPSLSEHALPPEGLGERSGQCGCHHQCPDLEERLRATLDLLKHRAFLTSLGTRYLPIFRAEVVLLETFPETETERGPLLDRLRLPRRLGLSRLEIEQALVLRGADVVDSLGLDPVEHVLVPVPFDVYLRAAARFGWGRRPHWTHFDGYQVLRGWRLRALVGGNAQYGGPADLCSIGRDDPRDEVLTRFCVLRRRHLQEHVGRAAQL